MLKILSWEYPACGKIVRMSRSLRLPRTKILIFQGTHKQWLIETDHLDSPVAQTPHYCEKSIVVPDR